MGFSDYYKDYFLWNDALWKYYFEGENTSEQVLLYADDNIIRNIGSNCSAIKERFEELEGHDDYLDFFYESILFNNIENINHFFYLTGTPRGIPQRSITEEYLSEARIVSVQQAYRRQTIQTTAIIDFARALASIKQEFDHKCPCLCYVVFLILEYNRSRTYEGIITKLREKSGLANASILPDQFMELFRSVEEWSKCDTIPRFSADRIRGEQPLVGVLKYNLVLNRSELTEMQDALFEYSIEWDESVISYRSFTDNYILPIVTREQIKNALRKPENYTFFYNLFHSFSPDNYIPSRELPKKQRGHFFLLYDREYHSFLLKTDVRAFDNNAENDSVMISCNAERECGLYAAIYRKGTVNLESYLTISYESEQLKVLPIKGDWLFFIMTGKFFQQVLSPVNNEGCLIITHKNIDEAKRALNQDVLQDYTQSLRTVFGKGQNVFFIEKWRSNTILKDDQENEEQLANEQVPAGPKLTNGILNPAFKRCYLPEALPFIQCEKEVLIDNVKVYEDKEHTRLASCIDKVFISGINIVRLYMNIATNKYQEFYVVVSGEEIGVIRVKGSNTANGNNTIWYDSWGCSSVIKDDNCILCDNCISYAQPVIQNIDNELVYKKTSDKSLVPLLKSYAYARKETRRKYLLDRDISKIINYVSIVERWNIDNNELSYVKYKLINFGILSMATDDVGERRFEVNNPRLVPIEDNKHVLYGAYTCSQFEAVKLSREIISYELINVLDIHSDLLIVRLINGEHDSVSGIPVSKQSQAEALLKIAQGMNLEQFREVFMNAPEDTEGTKKNGCVFMTPSKDQFYSSILENGIRYALYKRKDLTFHQIPTSLQKLYVCRVNNKPLMMWNNDTSTISFTWSMGIPYYVERILCLLSKSVGTREKVFGIEHFGNNKLYDTITSFKLQNPIYKDRIFAILSDNMTSTKGIMEYQEYKGSLSLFHRIKEQNNKSSLCHEFVLVEEDEVKLIVQYEYGRVTAFGYQSGNAIAIVGNDVNDIISSYINGRSLNWGNPIDEPLLTTIEEINTNYQRLKIISKRQ